jgi:hypothetical protein
VLLTVLALLAAAAPSPSPLPEPAPVFEAMVGGKGPLAGDEENKFLLPCGGGPASIAVAPDGRWWVLDAIGSRVVVFERDGRTARSIDLPAKKGKAPLYRGDLALDGAGGFWLLDVTTRAVERYDADGKPAGAFGGEKLPKADRGYSLLDLPQRISAIADRLIVGDVGSENLLWFKTDGSWDGASPAPASSSPTSSGGFVSVDRQGDAWMLLVAAARHAKPLGKLAPLPGNELRDAEALGESAAGEPIVASIEDGKQPGVRIVKFDKSGKPLSSSMLPSIDDGVSPTRRFRLTPDGKVAWFRIAGNRFQAFESAL